MTTAFTRLTRRAAKLIDDLQFDQAIELIRSEKSSRTDGRLCGLLARAFYGRGDAKGDIYSAHFFADRALDLGQAGTELHAIRGVCAFRKENYPEAAVDFSTYVSVASNPQNRYLLGMSLLYAGRAAEALPWLEGALKSQPELPDGDRALAEARAIVAGAKPERIPAYVIARGLGGVKDRRPAGADSPYPSNALSKLAGVADQAKDFKWLADNIPCQQSCPAGTDIPAYLTAVYEERYDEAYRINLRDNVFPAVLGRVCARPCEIDCRHGWDGLGNSVAICFSKRSGADHRSQQPVVLAKIFPPSGKKVAIVGAGPAGLAAARNLALFGHGVTVYEQYPTPGGMMVQGIPGFRLPREHISREIDQISALGVEIRCNARVGEGELTLEKLTGRHDAVVLAAGTLRPNMLELPGKELKGILHGLDYLEEINRADDGPVGKNVVVIGGGFTAMDCARTALRMGCKLSGKENWRALPLGRSGAKVSVLYRRSVAEMLVTPGEIEELEHEGIDLQLLVSPLEFLGKNGQVTGVHFIRNQLGEPDSSGRRRPQPVLGSEFVVKADLVLLATGQFPQTAWIDGKLRKKLVAEDQWLISSGEHVTALEKVFVAGDFSTGARSLIDAIGHAKQAARKVDDYLMGVQRIRDIALIDDDRAFGRIREMDFVEVQTMPVLTGSERTLTAEVETGFDRQLAVDEAQRCYRCHYKFEIDPDRCIYCDWCIKAKPRPKCIVKVSRLNFSAAGEIIGFEEAKGSDDTHLIYINQDDCIRCGACVEACPVDAISLQKVSKTSLAANDGCGLV